jgi:hypothetical protein
VPGVKSHTPRHTHTHWRMRCTMMCIALDSVPCFSSLLLWIGYGCVAATERRRTSAGKCGLWDQRRNGWPFRGALSPTKSRKKGPGARAVARVRVLLLRRVRFGRYQIASRWRHCHRLTRWSACELVTEAEEETEKIPFFNVCFVVDPTVSCSCMFLASFLWRWLRRAHNMWQVTSCIGRICMISLLWVWVSVMLHTACILIFGCYETGKMRWSHGSMQEQFY